MALSPTLMGLRRCLGSLWSQTTPCSAVHSWAEQWTAATEELQSDVTFEVSANRLRSLIQTGLLRYTDLRDNPERFFEAHRILARHAVAHGPGFWIRFTVQYNLFAGTVLAVGSQEQVMLLDDMQESGQLGCFALTEQLAGVQSGLVVETIAEYDSERESFNINTPHHSARKNWISQGATADKAVLVADLSVDGANVGPHAFLADFRDGKYRNVVTGIKLADMGRKTTGNDLDNAWLHFENLQLPRSSLLSRYCSVTADGKYEVPPDTAGIKAFDMIGQRLYSGRIAVAQAALEYTKTLFAATRAYSDAKRTWSPAGQPVLTDIPHLAHLYDEADDTLETMEKFVAECEKDLCECLRESSPPSPDLALAIATCKVRAVETSIALTFRLKQEVGSFALMADAGFRHLDFLQCCKFAEGDSRILMQKMARDALKQYGDGSMDKFSEKELQLCSIVIDRMNDALKGGADKTSAWNTAWQDIYALADAVMNEVQSKYSTRII